MKSCAPSVNLLNLDSTEKDAGRKKVIIAKDEAFPHECGVIYDSDVGDVQGEKLRTRYKCRPPGQGAYI